MYIVSITHEYQATTCLSEVTGHAQTRILLFHFHLKLPDVHQLYTDVRETPPFYYKLQPLPVKEPPNQRRSLSCDDHFCMQVILLNHNSARNYTPLST